jgi:hypothetical protein
MNSYPEFRFSKCPDCQNQTGQRTLPLIIHIEPHKLIAFNYTSRYCKRCDMLIAHKHEIEHKLTELFQQTNKEVIGNPYLVFGTVEKKAMREHMKQPKALDEILKHVHDFKSYQTIQMRMGGWFQKGAIQPIMEFPPSTEWLKHS